MRVFSNSAMTVDGKLATAAYDHLDFSSREDRRYMSVLRAQADAVLVGGRTFRNWPRPLVERLSALGPGDAPPDRAGPMINAVLTRRGVVGESPAPRWPDPRVKLLVFGPPELDARAHREAFGAEVCARGEPDVGWVLDELQARGCRSVLVEGGGELIAAVLAAGRLCELFVTVAPVLLGGREAPTLVDGPGFSAPVDLRLQGLREVDGEVFLHYVVGASGCKADPGASPGVAVEPGRR